MPLQIYTDEYYAAIVEDVAAAWGLTEGESVFLGQPTSATPHHYAAIDIGSVTMDWDGLRSVEQTYEFQIVYWAPFEESPDFNVALTKSAKANALLLRLSQGSLYAGTGVMPLVTSVTYDAGDDEERDWYCVAVTFTVRRYATV